MRKIDPMNGLAAMLVLAGILGVGMMVPGCPESAPPPPTPECTTNADCDEGEVCNEDGECEAAPAPECTSNGDCDEGEVCNEDGECEAAPTPECTSNGDCDEGEVCNEDGECETAPVVEDPYETNVFMDEFNRVHGLHQAAFPDCTTCHHSDPPAGLSRCSECHSLDPNEFNSYKFVAHDENESGDGCRSCHSGETTDDGAWRCSFCHTALLD